VVSSCANIGKKARAAVRKERGRERDVAGGAVTTLQTRSPDPFEDGLKRALAFAATVQHVTDSPEPDWSQPHDEDSRLFPGWAAPMTEVPLRPQGTFVAEAKKAMDDFLAGFELGVDVQVAGAGAGVSTTGLPLLLKKSFTPHQWLIMWRASQGRNILIKAGSATQDQGDKNMTPMQSPYDEITLENKILGLQEYTGGDGEHITVITHTENSSGSFSLFEATFPDSNSGTGEIIRLDRVAMMLDVPAEICKTLLKEEGLSKHELRRRRGARLRCLNAGELPRPRIVNVSTARDQAWRLTGSAWRRALNIPIPGGGDGPAAGAAEAVAAPTSYTPGDGLVTTIPQMVALLHLRQMAAMNIKSSPALRFGKPIDIGDQVTRRGVKLDGTPGGISFVGTNPTIAVLFPKHAAWARELIFWA